MGTYTIETDKGTFQVETDEGNPSDAIPKAKPPVPAGLVGPPPSRLSQAITNFPSSLAHAVTHPSFPGMPSDAPEAQPGEDIGPTPEKIGRELSGYAHAFMHPEEDPVGAGLMLAGGARGILKHGTATTPVSPEGLTELGTGAVKGAYQGGTEMVPLGKYGIKARVPAVVAGGALGETMGYGLSRLPIPGAEYAPAAGMAIGAGAPVVKGGFNGLKDSLQRIMSRRQEPRSPGTNIPPQPEGQAPGPVGPLGKPSLPSGRKVPVPGAIAAPVPSPLSAGTSPLPNPAPPSTPIEAANKDTHLPGVTQADEFKGSVVQNPIGQTPGPQQPQVTDPRLNRTSIQKHLEGIAKKTENVKAYASDPELKITVPELESLKADLTQADDPAKYHAAIQKAKTMGKEVYAHAKGRGAPIPDSPYRTFSLDDIDTAIKHLKSSNVQKSSKP